LDFLKEKKASYSFFFFLIPGIHQHSTNTSF